MDLELLPVVMLTAGGVLLYSAVTNHKPLGVIQAALKGEDISKVPPIYTDSSAGNGSADIPGVIPGPKIPGTPEADGDARTDPPNFDPNTDGIIPRLPGEGSTGGGGMVSFRPAPSYNPVSPYTRYT